MVNKFLSHFFSFRICLYFDFVCSEQDFGQYTLTQLMIPLVSRRQVGGRVHDKVHAGWGPFSIECGP